MVYYNAPERSCLYDTITGLKSVSYLAIHPSVAMQRVSLLLRLRSIIGKWRGLKQNAHAWVMNLLKDDMFEVIGCL